MIYVVDILCIAINVPFALKGYWYNILAIGFIAGLMFSALRSDFGNRRYHA